MREGCCCRVLGRQAGQLALAGLGCRAGAVKKRELPLPTLVGDGLGGTGGQGRTANALWPASQLGAVALQG